MNYNYKYGTPAGILRYSCGVVFCLFCFFYIYFIQGEVLAEAQHVYSRGLTVYHEFASPLIVTFILLVIQWLFQSFVSLPQRSYALTYFPSLLILTIITDIDRESISSSYVGAWIWVAPILLIIYALVIMVARKLFVERFASRITILETLIPNYIILLVQLLFVGAFSSSPDVYHYELKTERLIREGRYEDATRVGETSLEASKRLTILRMYALSMEDSLAERMFSYPQYYGADGILDVTDTLGTYRVTTTAICRRVGAICGNSIKTTKRYLDLLVGDDSLRTPRSIEYKLCYQLLDKDLLGFSNTIYKYHNPYHEVLQKAYQEALLLKADQDGDSLEFITSSIVQRYQEYKLMKQSYPDSTECSNRTRREFGDTYWWFYEN